MILAADDTDVLRTQTGSSKRTVEVHIRSGKAAQIMQRKGLLLDKLED